MRQEYDEDIWEKDPNRIIDLRIIPENEYKVYEINDTWEHFKLKTKLFYP